METCRETAHGRARPLDRWRGKRAAAWEPTKPVEFVVPAARAVARTRWRGSSRARETHKLSPSRSSSSTSRAGRERRALYVKGKKGDAPTSSHAVQPVHDAAPHRVPFNWKDLTPSAVALDELSCWSCETPYKTANTTRGGEREEWRDEDGWHRGGAGRPDPDHPARAGDRREVHLRALKGGARCASISWAST